MIPDEPFGLRLRLWGGGIDPMGGWNASPERLLAFGVLLRERDHRAGGVVGIDTAANRVRDHTVSEAVHRRSVEGNALRYKAPYFIDPSVPVHSSGSVGDAFSKRQSRKR